MIEIGSEYWLEEPNPLGETTILEYLKSKGHYHFLYSGRTAIEIIIKNHPDIKCALLPNYLCESIITPFKEHNIKIEYYSVSFKENKFIIDIDDKLSEQFFFLGINYFGHYAWEMENVYTKLKNEFSNIVIIDDATQNLFDLSTSNNIDYQFSSIRKWFPIVSGASLKIMNNNTLEFQLKSNHLDIYDFKKEAMALKQEYIVQNQNSLLKKEFLERFKRFNSKFGQYYENRAIDEYSMRFIEKAYVDQYRIRRERNSEFIINELKDEHHLNMIDYYSNTAQLFIPIFFNDKETRDRIRHLLIENGIYCPFHWPIPNEKDKGIMQQDLYDRELSIICDHRYTPEDLRRLIDLLKVGLHDK